MGVLGLWHMIDSVGHPIKVEALEGRRLGVDANVWLYKFIRGFRENDNNIDSHKLGLFNRISKLLFYKIKPIFVFDGPAPVLKRKTLERRQNVINKQLAKNQDKSMKVIAKYLKEQIPGVDLDNIKIQHPELTSNNLVAAGKLTDEDRDLFYLPPEVCQIKSSDDDDSSGVDEPTSVHVKQENLIYQLDSDDEFYIQPETKPSVDIHSKDFESLPAEVRYEFLKDLKESRKRIRRADNLPEDAGSFSSFQLERLKARRSIQEKIEKCEKDICSMYTGDCDGKTIRSFRMQSDSTSTMLYLQNSTPKTTSTGVLSNPQPSMSQDSCFNSETDSIFVSQAFTDISSQSRVNSAQMKPLFDYGGKSGNHAGTSVIRIGDVMKEYSTAGSKANLTSIPSPTFSEPSDSETDIEEVSIDKLSQTSVSVQPTSSEETSSRLNSSQSTEVEPSSQDETNQSEHNSSLKETTIESTEPTKTPNSSDNSDVEELDRVPPNKSNFVTESSQRESSTSSPQKVNNDTILLIDSCSSHSSSPTPEPTIVIETSHQDTPEVTIKPPSSKQVIIEEELSSEKGFQDDPTEQSAPPPSSSSSQPTPAINSPAESATTSSQPVRQPEVQAHLTHKNLAELREVKSTSTRVTNRVTTKIVEESKELLRLFGIPYIDAAGEAEAQCALLEKLKLTEGTITDDSDVWLFGAQNVFRNFFKNDTYIKQYKMPDIEHHIKMTRENLVCFAMLVGSDYTDGIMNVGPVTAVEILSEFPGENMEPLVKFRNWREKYARSKDRVPGSKKRETFLKFKLPEEFPSRAVFEGYMKPMADTSTAEFTWGTPELDELREYARRNFGWDSKKIDDTLLPVMKKLSERTTQTRIDSFFFKTAANQNPQLFRSKRVNQALDKIAKTNVVGSQEVVLTEDEDDGDDEADPLQQRSGPKTQAKRPAKRVAGGEKAKRGTKKSKTTTTAARSKKKESEEVSEKNELTEPTSKRRTRARGK